MPEHQDDHQRIRPAVIAVGLVGVAVVALITPWNDWPLGNTQFFSNYLPPPVTLLLLAAALVGHRMGRSRMPQRERRHDAKFARRQLEPTSPLPNVRCGNPGQSACRRALECHPGY